MVRLEEHFRSCYKQSVDPRIEVVVYGYIAGLDYAGRGELVIRRIRNLR